MMNIIKKIFILYLTCCSLTVFGQNLVQNGGFENSSGFPNSTGQWPLATNWSNANSSTASPDYLHTNGSGLVQLPNSVFGTVSPYLGNAVMGLCMLYPSSPNFREYISQHLSTPLTVGSSYTFSFYISNGTPVNYGGVGVNNVQVDFSVNPINQLSSSPLGYTPLLSTGTMIYSNNWIPVSFTFVATAPYAYFAIGNFMNDANTVYQQFDPATNLVAYYFIDEVSLTLNNNNISIAGDSLICQGDSALLQASNSSIFLWADSLTPNIIISTDSVLAVAPTTTTTYLVYGTNDTSSFTVNVVATPSVNLGNDTTLCQGQSVTLNSGVAALYLWSNNSTASSIIASSQGTYWVQASNGQCSSTDSITISINQYPAPNLGNDTTLCQGQSVTLNSGAATSYLWSNNSTAASIIASTQGTYWVQASNGQCSAKDSITISINQYPAPNLGNDTTLCQGQSVTLNCGAATTYLWSNNSTTYSVIASTQGTYWVQTSNGQCSSADSITISVNQYPAPNLGNDTTLCQGQSVTLNAGAATTYLWSNGSNASTIIVSTQGTYWVQASNGQCSTSDTLNLLISDCEVEIEMPNVFTPNNDGVNDNFVPIKYKGISNANLVIYNRWGQKVFNTDDFMLGWNGTYKDNNCAAGTYFWIVQYTTILNETKELKGHLTLIK